MNNGTEWNEKNPGGEAAGQDMQEFEAALLRAMRRVDAPEGFAARVVALAEAERRTKLAAQPEPRPWWRMGGLGSIGWKPVWGAMAAVLVAGVLGGHAVHERHVEQAQASRQFDVSVQITDRALEHAREQLRRKGVPLEEQ